MLWVYFTILSALAWTFVNLIDKYTIDKYIQNPMISVIFIGFLGLIAAMIISQFTEILVPSTEILILSLSAGIIYVFASLFYFKAILIEEVSRVTPLYAITPIFILILATVFLGESFAVQKYLGIFIIVIGSFLISLRRDVKFKLSRAFGLMILGTLTWAVYNIILKYALNYLTYWDAFFWTRIGSFLITPFLFYRYRKQTIEIITKRPKGGLYLAIAEPLNVVALVFSTIALSYGFVSLVSALGQIQNFIVLIFAILISVFRPQIIKEELKGTTILQKILAISLISFGAVLIV